MRVKKSGLIIIIICILAAFLIGGAFAFHAYVEGDSLRQSISKRVSRSLHVDGQLAPLIWNGATFRSSKFTATGTGSSKLATLQLTNISAHLNLWELLRWHWVIDRINAEELNAVFATHPSEAPGTPTPTPRPSSSFKLSRFLPSDLSIEKIDLASVNLKWETDHNESGQWLGATVHVRQSAPEHWEIEASGGKVQHAGYPQLQVDEASATLNHNTFEIHHIDTKITAGGELQLKGTIAIDQELEANLDSTVSGLDVEKTLPNSWHMTGRGSGQINYQGDLNRFDQGRFTGLVQIVDSKMDLSPLFGKMQQFVKLGGLDEVRLDSISFNFEYQNQKGRFSNLTALYQDQIRIEGSGSFEPGALDGTVQIGLNSNILAWIPGSGDSVFTEDRDGLHWATAKISGSPEKPKEDLSKRLIGAVEKKMTRDLKDNAKDAAKSLLDLFRH
jgi:hypothetical protein